MNAVLSGGSADNAVSDPRCVLIVDDEPTMRLALSESLRRNGYSVVQAADGREAIDRIASAKPWLVLTDLKMPRSGGLEVVKEVKRRCPAAHVVVMTAYGTVETAVEAMKCGAVDYLLKPFAAEHLEQVLVQLEAGSLDGPTPDIVQTSDRSMLGEDPAMAKVLALAEGVATSQATVLIQGESGTGKELLARFIHNRSPRGHRPFIAVNCAALPDGLLESELFGHERGAFTGALTRKLGKFEMAHHGTILLDEISEMNLGLQAKLLRVLQEREVDRIGGREPIRVDIRVIATTNRSLRREVEQGRFREDLFYRLNVFPITLPPLRERPSDIPLLARHFVRVTAARNGVAAPTITEPALAVLLGRVWKGNVRELENAIERAVLLAGEDDIGPQHVAVDEAASPATPGVPVQTAASAQTGASAQAASPWPNGSLWEMERDLIMQTLDRVKGNRTHAAKALGISIRTLRNKLREYRQLSPPAAALSPVPKA